jgi:hypothetical protein
MTIFKDKPINNKYKKKKKKKKKNLKNQKQGNDFKSGKFFGKINEMAEKET